MFSAHIITRSKLAHCCEWPWYPLMCTWSSWPRFERPPFVCPALLASSWGGGSYISLPQTQPMASSGQLLPQMSSSSLTTPSPCLPWEPVKNTARETIFRFLGDLNKLLEFGSLSTRNSDWLFSVVDMTCLCLLLVWTMCLSRLFPGWFKGRTSWGPGSRLPQVEF